MKICCKVVLILTILYPLSSYSEGLNTRLTSQTDSLYIQEKVYLQTDRDTYYPGEDIWFKAYLTDATERLLSVHSGNLHVEFISPESKILYSRIVRLDEGLGNGDFLLSEKLNSGCYRIRAYTNYMRNFSDELFFNKIITVINPADAVKILSLDTDQNGNKPNIGFYPEGGSLVDSVPSLIAFKAVSAAGEGCDVTGAVYTSNGEVVTTYKSTHNGMGTFSMTPVRGIAYYTITKNLLGDSVKMEIPGSFSTGIVLNISRSKNKELIVTVRTNAETLPLVVDHDLTLTVSARNTFLKKAAFRMKSTANRFIMPVDDLPDGIVMLTLSGADNLPICERLVFVQNTEDYRLRLELNKPLYNQRDSVSVRISLPENSLSAQDAFLSLSATKIISENSPIRFPSTISSWFLLESDVRGPVEKPSYYFDISKPDRLKDLDLLLLTQGWRDFKWKYDKINYSVETGFAISGKVLKKLTASPLNNSSVTIAIFDNGNPQIFNIPTDSAGRFCLGGLDLTGNTKAIISATGKKDKLKGRLVMDSLNYTSGQIQDKIHSDLLINENHSGTVTPSIVGYQSSKENLDAFIQYTEIKNSIRKKYKLSDTINPGEVRIIAKRQELTGSARSRSRYYLQATPDFELKINPELEVYKNVYQLIRSKYMAPQSFPKAVRITNPVFMVDGVKVTGEYIAGFPVSMVERIDVLQYVSSYAVFGSLSGANPTKPMDGVFSIITRSPDNLSLKSNVDHSATIKLSGYNEPRIFYAPKHHTTLESDYKPDLRTTLFWEPNIRIENNKDVFLNYFNADNPSKVKIMVEGITSTGIPVTGTTEYDVK